MKNLTIIEKVNNSGEAIRLGQTLTINPMLLVGVKSKSLFIRKAKNGTMYISQRGNGGNCSGDVCSLDSKGDVIVNASLFLRLSMLAKKANAIIK